MIRKKALVTGANGQVGQALRDIAPGHPGFEFVFLSREDMPIHHYEGIRNVFHAVKPDVLVNCAAYTAVDRAESERDLAMLVNAEAPGVLASICREHATRFIHLSTDYVFDGKAHAPYREDDPTAPASVYGLSKREGEKRVLEADPDAIVIRTSWVYHEHGRNFVKTMMRLMGERERVGVVNDQYGSPTYAGDLADCIMRILESDTKASGIFHYSNLGDINWYDFAVAIRDILGSPCIVEAITTEQYPTPAPRPAYSVLSKEKIQRTFGIRLIPWRQSLEGCLARLKDAAGR
jgi:dTDP-4-dehydrorhamnose reductase